MPRYAILAAMIPLMVWGRVPGVSVMPTVTSAANPWVGVAPGSIATVMGTNLSLEMEITDLSPWPVNLGGVRVDVADSAGIVRQAGLLYVSPSQINLEIPADSAVGAANLIILPATLKPVRVPFKIQAVAPALYSVDASGLAAATATRILIPSQISSPISVYSCPSGGQCLAAPIDLDPDSNVDMTLKATGLYKADTRDVRVNFGSQEIVPEFAGPDPVTAGMDQVRFSIPFSMRGVGEVGISITADGTTSNTVKIDVR